MPERNPTLLFLDSASGSLYIALLQWKEGSWHLLFRKEEPYPQEERIDQIVEEIEKKYSFPPSAFALGEGPGYFTSLRNGFAYIKALATLLEKPIYLFPSPLLYSHLIEESKNIKNFLLLIQANRKYLYGVFQKEILLQTPGEWEIWIQEKNPLHCFFLEGPIPTRKLPSSSIEKISLLSLEHLPSFLPPLPLLHERSLVPLEALPNYGIPIVFKKYEA